MSDRSIKVADVSQIEDGHRKVIYFDRKEVVLFNRGGQFYAVANLCPHRGGPLSEGEIENNVVVCPLHGARFDIRTGEGLEGPHRCNIKAYDVSVEESAVRLRCD